MGLRVKLYLVDSTIMIEWELVSIGRTEIFITLVFDWISLSFSSIVFLISRMVLIYSYIYIRGGKWGKRFVILVFLFVLSMALLIFRPNLIRILLGWDGLGLVSYCLVIYYQNTKSASAGLLTVLSNRVGDVCILLGICWLFNFGGWNFIYWQYLFVRDEVLIVLLLVVIAAITKSAQIPFSAWLPAAIAAPTPVSSLVHSSTLVTAGVYLLIRFSESLGNLFFLLIVSVLTIFISGVGANYEIDLKKIIALSTLSQLGVIMIILSLGVKEIAFLHLITHALFKSLLFLCAGVYIHSMGDIQDIRLLGGVSDSLPVTSIFFTGCSLSLCGFPFLAGFYSKDLIIEYFFISYINIFVVFLLIIGTIMTLTYSVRLILFLIIKNLGVSKDLIIVEERYMLYPIRLLFVCSVYVGSYFTWIYLPIYEVVLPIITKMLILFLLFYFFILSWGIFYEFITIKIFNRGLMVSKWFLGSIWFMPILSTILFIPLFKIGLVYIKIIDHGWVEKYGGQGFYKSLRSISLTLNYSYSFGIKFFLIARFLVLMFIGIILLI